MINRLLGTIYILMNKGTVTASELAERFEVSVRTIYRDIDTLSMAGIPVYTTKGRGGGICLMEQFVLDKMLVSKQEQQQILAALASLKETGAHEEEEILSKLGDFFKEKAENWVAIDFSDWSGRRKELFQQIKYAILNRRVLSFDYYSQYGEMSSRTVEPVQLLFKEYTWYVRAFCRTRRAMRLFKVLRMKRVTVLDETFDFRDDTSPEHAAELFNEYPFCKKGCPSDTAFSPDNTEYSLLETLLPEITLWIDRHEAYRIYDRFDEDEIAVLPDGNFQVSFTCPLDDWVYGMILSFGPAAKILSPEYVRTEVRRRIVEMGKAYE
ncbi:MAG: YafY family transcriptional regulator [Eubacterium sp.]|nr:YafY family transcriptional regulator [Eubacterium sp.]